MGRVRDLAKGSCQAWIEKNEAEWAANYPEWSL
jgi:glycyl-tRNA synthetase alpha chain